MALDGSGNLFVVDSVNQRIRKIDGAGAVTTLAGSVWGFQNGNGTAARFANPHGIATDTSGNVYVADTDNNAIRKITPAGAVTTLAGEHRNARLGGRRPRRRNSCTRWGWWSTPGGTFTWLIR